MPSEDRVRLALDALARPIGAFRSTLAATTDEMKSVLGTCKSTWVGVVARVGAELGPLAAGRIDVERFAALVETPQEADPVAIAAIERSLETLAELAARGDDLFLVTVPAGGSLYEAVGRALGEIGRAFGAARLVHEVRTYGPSLESPALEPLSFSRWSKSERRLAAPLVVRVQGGDLRAAGLAEFLDGRQRIILVVEGDCVPVPLVRLVAPGTFVLQTGDGAGLDRLAAWDGPGIAAIVPDSAARFVHDPAAGASPSERTRIDSLPEKPPRKAVGGLSAAQQAEELALLRTLAAKPAAADRRPAGAAGEAAEGGAAQADPADKLAAWLLSRVDLSDLG